jgi:phosphoglycolate phosphatase
MLIIFDWDGTLCDSTGRIVAAMREAAITLSAPVPPEDAVRNVIGLGLPEAMEELFPTLPLAQRDEMRECYSSCYVELDREPAGLFPGAMEVLEELRSRGHLLAVATGKGRRGLDRVLTGLGMEAWFDATRCADETCSKPDPQMLYELLEELQVTADSSLMIGDSEYDLMMAGAAPMASVGVSYGVHSAQRLGRHAPLAVLDKLEELLQLPGLLPGQSKMH